MITGIPRLAVVASALTDAPRQAARLARLAGFDALQFDAFSSALRMPDLSRTGRRDFLHVLASEGRQLAGLRSDLGAEGFGAGADVDRLLDGLDRAMETAVGLGAPLLCLDLGRLPTGPKPTPAPRPTIAPGRAGLILLPESFLPAPSAPPPQDEPGAGQFIARVDSALAELGRRADRYGCTVALRSDLARLSALERAIRSVNCPNFGIDLDPVALLIDPWQPDECFSRLGSLIRHVRGRDATLGDGGRTMAAVVGQGSVPWTAIMADLDGANYSGWITLDPFDLAERPQAAHNGARRLRAGA